MRSAWLTLISLPFLFIVPLSFLHLHPTRNAGFFPWFVVIAGLLDFLLLYRMMARPLGTVNLEQLRASYMQLFFVGYALAQAPALIGFVATFETRRLWVYFLGVALALPGMFLIAPTSGNIAKRQRKLREGGSSLSLLEALSTPPGRFDSKSGS